MPKITCKNGEAKYRKRKEKVAKPDSSVPPETLFPASEVEKSKLRLHLSLPLDVSKDTQESEMKPPALGNLTLVPAPKAV